jgi:RNA polymerase sigma-70 factor (ECF subfamily)
MVDNANNEQSSLEQKMAQALAGDKTAYSQVLSTISRHLSAYLTNKVAPKDRDDVVQEILLSVHKARHTYDNARPLLPWVMAIAKYRLLDHWRRHYGHGFDQMTDIEDLKDILSTDATKTIESHEDIRRALASLPIRQQEIINLMYRQDKSVQEVATLLHMSVSAVKVAAHRSYKILRQRLSA